MSTKYLIAYAAAAAAFFTLDMLWLGVLAKDFYRAALSGLLLDQPKLLPAAMFYAIYVVGIVIFAIVPALAADSWSKAMLLGALFGFFTYLTYDMTNLATLKGWPVRIVVVDVLWGVLLSSVSATVGYVAANSFSR